MPAIPIALQSAPNEVQPATSERLVNMFTEQVTGTSTRAAVVLRSCPGLVRFGTSTDPVYGLAEQGGRLYAVTETGLQRVDAAGGYSAQTYTGSIAATGTDVLWNGIEFYLGPSHTVAYIDGYFLRTEPAYDGRFAWAGPYSSTWNALDFATAEGSPDKLVAMVAAHRELWLFGARTTEVWYNSGDLDQPFQRVDTSFVERGCIGAAIIVGQVPYWLGDDGVVYGVEGYLPIRVSTHSVEQRITKLSDVPVAFSAAIGGHQCYCLRYESLCLCFDTTTQLWHERETWERDRFVGTCSARLDGQVYVGTDTGIFRFDGETYTDDGEPLLRRIVTPPMFVEDVSRRMARVELLADMGRGLATGQGSDPQVMMRWSDDGGRTWSNEHWRSLGDRGKYAARARWNRMGTFRERCFDIQVTDPVPFAVMGLSST